MILTYEQIRANAAKLALDFEKAAVQMALHNNDFNVNRTAKALSVNRSTLYKALDRFPDLQAECRARHGVGRPAKGT